MKIDNTSNTDNIILKLIPNSSLGIFILVMFALAGLGLFLVSIKLMSSSLKQMTGTKITKVMKILKKNPLIACFVGVLFTTMIQSSDGAVALAIGLVAAGLLDLKTAIAFILGANIGTATTSIIVASADIDSFKYVKYSLFSFAFLGAFGLIVTSEERKTRVAMLFFAIGAIFIGLEVMGLGFKNIAGIPSIKNGLKTISNPFAALFVSMTMTGLLQSSSAVVTIVQGFYPDGMALTPALAMVVGANIGTTFTALIASLGSGKKDTLRIAVVWLITNIVTSFIIMPLIATGVYGEAIQKMNPTPKGNDFDLAIGHLLFNTVLVIMFIPFTKQLAWVSAQIVREKNTSKDYKFDLRLSEKLIHESPILAYEAAKKVSTEMGKMAYEAENQLKLYIKTKDKKHYALFEQIHTLIEQVRMKLSSYLIELGSKDITEELSSKQLSLVLSLRSINATTELMHRILRIFKKTYDKKEKRFKIDDATMQDFKGLLSTVMSMTKRAYKQVDEYTYARHKDIAALQKAFNALSKAAIEINIKRISKKTFYNLEFDFAKVVRLLERTSHHAGRVSNYQRKGRKKPIEFKLSQELTEELFSNTHE
ncbi:Na/Pi cotransporter family protein [Mycoplasma marinum]|uniref:Na/Pi cotransporter family protein n=1 Tax=Mycoplasma marinum TaxID=1937190 RepID=A0A4R0XVG6_9MOLU|nr:Na/Pi symporter [Mycoplasma marinum]TCG11742.1 hypothetical protein C4B24_01155 [Mycoplasma marinum]